MDSSGCQQTELSQEDFKESPIKSERAPNPSNTFSLEEYEANHQQKQKTPHSTMIHTQKDQCQREYLLSRDPMQEYFSLTCQTIKLNSPHMNHVCSINTKKLYQEAVEMNVPFHKW